ncbi:MAG: hypothetical protein WDZ77_02405 [Candidatus Pacearchaeota archaeon]
MAKGNEAMVLNFVAWLTGVLVSLSVGFALVDGVLGLPVWLGGNTFLPVLVGWVVVITTIASAVLAVLNK